MPGVVLSLVEREEIRAGIERAESCRAIASRLGRADSTVCREVARNGGRRRYRATTAEKRAQRCRRRPKTPKLVADRAARRQVNNDLRRGYSPAAVAVRLARAGGTKVCHETIYQALYSRDFRGVSLLPRDCLRSRRHTRRHRGYRARQFGSRPHVLGGFKAIEERPQRIEDRTEAGHWEGDLITGAYNRSAVITLIERTTRFVMLGHLRGAHSATEVSSELINVFTAVPDQLRRSLTWDRGTEMRTWVDTETATGLDIYFCDPHSPWQRGANENLNRLLRYWLPRGTDLSRHTRHDLERVASLVNDQPRKSLNWDTATERYAAAALH